ncbi:hypothetical protein NQ318_017205 [Aromia moschata]|uniref:Uncharacterized protein n=1 Tax=Aromia moschata TaxID=1265417 RepID=A0AAV8YNP1_9CUCU|nr:hypothetical protein NQ318_017205 [Aromia moschata]
MQKGRLRLPNEPYFRNLYQLKKFLEDVKGKGLERILGNAHNGFIYFSLGGNVKSKDLGSETVATILETLKELPYRVLWKFEADDLPGKLDNIKLIKWAPQQDILST